MRVAHAATPRPRSAAARIALALLGAALGVGSAAGAAETADRPRVVTADGPVRGATVDGVRRFLGLPYAAPPVGRLRWRPPEPPARWTEPREATRFGARCAQTSSLPTFSLDSATEDCLYLNVYAPARAPSSPPRPVMVWLHGGGFWEGSADEYDPTRLVQRGQVVVVTLNYRVGLFGFFAHPAIDAEGHAVGNYGLLDQQAALRWVRRNAAAFGGDPRRVTLFGESAGGYAVAYHLVSPPARGLFQRAIAQSNANFEPLTPLAAAEALGVEFATALGCRTSVPACLRALPAERLLAANPVAGVNSGGRYFPSAILDGALLPDQLRPLIARGRMARVPLINGSNSDEGLFFVAIEELASGHRTDARDVEAAIRAAYPADAARVAALYPPGAYPTPSAALGALYADRIYCQSRAFSALYARHVRATYGYEFADATAPSYLPSAGYPYRATHTFELPYLFVGFRGASGAPVRLSAAQHALSDQIIDYWTNFARTGRPDAPRRATLPAWPPLSGAEDRYQVFELPTARTAVGPPPGHHCDYWERVPPAAAAAD